MIVDIGIIISLFILPVFLIYRNVIPFRYKVHTLGLVALLSVIIVPLKGWGMEKLGLQPHAVGEHAIPYFLFTGGLGVALLIIAKLTKRTGKERWWKDSHFVYGFIVVSVLQEFVFRGFLIPELQLIFSSTTLIILSNALLFTFMHSIYSDNLPTLTMIFLGGIGFAAMYIYFPSLILISISHAILNFIVVYFGFFTQKRMGNLSIEGNPHKPI